jgi:hypothetical protein
MLTRGVSLLHDKARPHTAPVSQELLTSFGWDIVTHPPYSHDLAPSDYHYDTGIQKLVPRLQKCLDLDGDYVEK